MQKIYKQLTIQQLAEGVVFSSTLSKQKTEQVGDTTHEVKKEDADKKILIQRLLDDSFFDASQYKYNIIRSE